MKSAEFPDRIGNIRGLGLLSANSHVGHGFQEGFMPTKSSDSPRKPRASRARKPASESMESSVATEESSSEAPRASREEREDRHSSRESASSSDDFGDGVMDNADNSPRNSEGRGENSGGEGDDRRGNRNRRRRRRRGPQEENASSGRNTGGNRGRGGSGNRNRGGNRGGSGSGGGGGNRGANRGERSRGGHGSTRAVVAKSAVATTGQDVNEISGIMEGVLELHPKGYGFMRNASVNYASQDSDPFVSSSTVEKYNLREGVLIRGEVGPGSRAQGPRLHEVITIDGRTPEEYQKIKVFDTLTAINPFEQIKLETTQEKVTTRIMDLLTPIGKGQRALIVAPPRTGKTMLLQDIANSVSKNHPEVHLIVLLIDERPEEVTEMRRLVNGEVIASSMDRDVESHVRTSQLIIERGKRIAEAGGDAFILLDSITRTARAFNKWVGNTGRTMSGGLDVKAMDIPKKMFGTARRFDEGGSLTVVGTALIDTGSRMDEVIFQEFKGTGNMEMVLSRDLADRRIWPAIDITKSGTRREEKILDPAVMDGVIALRRALISMSPVEAMEELTRRLAMFPTNKEFLAKIRSVL